jgi:ubiquitin carboxyl-terminal hydrolase 7
VLDANFGGEPQPLPNSVTKTVKSRFYTNAYMLVYIRESSEEEILSPVREEEIPTHLLQRVKQDDEDARARQVEETERHLFMQLMIVVDNSLQNFHGFDVGFSGDGNVSANVKMKKDLTLGEFRNLLAEEILLKPEQIQLWNVIPRQNKTLRIDSVYNTAEMLASSTYLIYNSII